VNDSSIPGVAITGTIGAGKTAVAEAISNLLTSKELQHALIDLDWLGQVYPPPDSRIPMPSILQLRIWL
jgi:deoxyadenosine/deoxycytidine kinase